MNIDPKEIKDGFPYVVLSSQSTSFLSWIIQWRTKASYNHIMLANRTGYFASQNNVYQEVKIEKYMTKLHRLKYWKLNIPEADKSKILDSVNKKLKLPFWKRNYDYLAIIGQALGIKNISGPTHICSEDVMFHLSKAMEALPTNPSPEELNDHFEIRKDTEVLGRWAAD